MMYHISVHSRWSGMSRMDAKVIECSRMYDALMTANNLALEVLDRGADEVYDIEVMKDEDFCANEWNKGQHFSFENMKMGFRMYRNEVQE